MGESIEEWTNKIFVENSFSKFLSDLVCLIRLHHFIFLGDVFHDLYFVLEKFVSYEK